MKSPTRTPARKLAEGKSNAREAAVANLLAKQVAVVEYSFASDGGAQGTYLFGTRLPADSVVTNVYQDALVDATSGGAATVQLKAGSTNLTGATAYTSFTGASSIALASSASAIRVSSDSELQIAVAGSTLTAGCIRFCVEFYSSKINH